MVIRRGDANFEHALSRSKNRKYKGFCPIFLYLWGFGRLSGGFSQAALRQPDSVGQVFWHLLGFRCLSGGFSQFGVNQSNNVYCIFALYF